MFCSCVSRLKYLHYNTCEGLSEYYIIIEDKTLVTDLSYIWPQINREGLISDGVENTAKWIKQSVGCWNEWGMGGVHFFLILQVPFSRPRSIFVAIERNSIFKSLCNFYKVYYLQCLYLEINIWTFTVINGVQR